MFFLGASANIIVYVLVSAFFIICLQIKEDPKMPEISSMTANIITIHEPQQIEDCYEYQSFYDQEFEVEIIYSEYTGALTIKHYSPPIFYQDTILSGSTLRAPPYLV